MEKSAYSNGVVPSQEKENKGTHPAANSLLVSDLGWTDKEAEETRSRLTAFEDDWDAPGMESYDRQ
jgi:hypothetical protein